MNEGFFQYDPVRFLDYKLSCVLALLECLQSYDPDKGAEFLTFAHDFIDNALLDCCRHEEAGSFKSMDEYKAICGIAWLRNNSRKTGKEVVTQYAAEQNCSEETAEEYLKLASLNRSRAPFYSTMWDKDGEDTGEDVTFDNSWNYADILWLAEWDTMKTHPFAAKVISYLLRLLNENSRFEGFGMSPMALMMNGVVKKMDKNYKNNGLIKWNFTKFLISRDGHILARFEPTVSMKTVMEKVKAAL